MTEENVITFLGNGILATVFATVLIGSLWIDSRGKREMAARRRVVRTHYERLEARRALAMQHSNAIRKGWR